MTQYGEGSERPRPTADETQDWRGEGPSALGGKRAPTGVHSREPRERARTPGRGGATEGGLSRAERRLTSLGSNGGLRVRTPLTSSMTVQESRRLKRTWRASLSALT